MQQYTEKIHATRLLKMLEKKDPCVCCPAALQFNGGAAAGEMWSKSYEFSPCDICREFLGFSDRYDCPCYHLGGKDAIKHTWIQLEEKGYLE